MIWHLLRRELSFALLCVVASCFSLSTHAQEQRPIMRAVPVSQSPIKALFASGGVGASVIDDLTIGSSSFSIGIETATSFTQIPTAFICLNYRGASITTESPRAVRVPMHSKKIVWDTKLGDADVKYSEETGEYWFNLGSYSFLDSKGKVGVMYGFNVAYITMSNNKTYALSSNNTKDYVLDVKSLSENLGESAKLLNSDDTQASYQLSNDDGIGFGAFLGLLGTIGITEQFQLVPSAVLSLRVKSYSQIERDPDVTLDLGLALRMWL